MKRIYDYFQNKSPETPCLIVDTNLVKENYQTMKEALPFVDVYYAVKANPAPQIISLLHSLGAYFDAASVPEIDLCLKLGAKPEQISYSNPMKKQKDIEAAYAKGIRDYVFDSEAELEKLAAAAPGSRLFCRIALGEEGAAWPLAKKFGCMPDKAPGLMRLAKAKGMKPYGIAFHVGSQQTHVSRYAEAIREAGDIFNILAEEGIKLEALNMGGGFPVQYRTPVPSFEDFAQVINDALASCFPNNKPRCLAEPGRSMSASAGVIFSEVVLIKKDKLHPEIRWVYLDIGKFTGLVEAEAIEYPIYALGYHEEDEQGRVVLAGPTCDSVDIIYEQKEYYLPKDLKVGDIVEIQVAGAYTTTYSATAFNGFAPLKEHYIV